MAFSETSSVVTENCSRLASPNEVVMATSVASRPTAISTRPMRGVLWRASKGPPTVFQVGLEPCAEIHRARRWWNADVSQIPRSVTCRNVKRATEADGEVLKVAADSDALRVHIQRSAGRTRKLVAERHVVMDPIADGLHPLIPMRNSAEQLCGNRRKQIDFAIAAVHKIRKCLGWQLLHRHLARMEVLLIRLARVADERGVPEVRFSWGDGEPASAIPKQVAKSSAAISGCTFSRSGSTRSFSRDG